jgi:hypothetical protein
LLWAVPPVVLLAGWPLRWRKVARILAIAFVAGCTVSLPLILWDSKAFVVANFSIADAARFRMDALSYLALFAKLSGHVPGAKAATWIGFMSGALATTLVTVRGARTPAGYAAAVAVAHLVFFAFFKFAFCNYYYFLIGAFCCAAGALCVGSASADGSSAAREKDSVRKGLL